MQKRPFQADGEKLIDTRLRENPNDYNVFPVPACVGSGKTNLAFLGFKNFIEQHKDSKTFQFMVTPRIKLNKQQCIDAQKFFDTEYPEFNVKCHQVDSSVSNQSYENNKVEKNKEFWAGDQHLIIFICADTLWRNSICENKFEESLQNNILFNRLNGLVAVDEAHNFENQKHIIYGDLV